MKRFLSLFLVLVLILSTFASCNLFPQKVEETDIQEAVKELKDQYKKLDGSSISAGHELIAQIKIGKTVFNVTWESSTEKVSFELKDGVYVVALSKDITETTNYTLTAHITSEGGQSADLSFNLILAVESTFGMIATPVIGETYKLAVLHGGKKQVVYFNGESRAPSYPWYLTTSTDVTLGVDVTLEPVDGVEGAFRLRFVNAAGETLYIRTYQREGEKYTMDGTIELTATRPEEYYTFDAERNAIIWTNELDSKIFLCCSGSYDTIQSSQVAQYFESATTYPVRFYGAGGVEDTLPEQNIPTLPTGYTSQDVVDLLYSLENGQTTEDTYAFTGIVTKIDTPYSEEYKNITITVVVEGKEDKPILVYRAKDAGGVGIENIKVGDTVTARGPLTNYNGKYETATGTMIEALVPGEGGDEPVTPPVGGEDEVIVLDLTGNANLVSGSAAQNVFAANGITLTNDKSSSSSDLTVQESYAQRFYAGSKIKIEYPGMTKIVLTLDDYSDGKYLKGFDGMTVEGATITRENDVVTIVFDAPVNEFVSAEFASQVRCEKIEVYTGEVEGGNQGGTDEPVTPPAPTYTAPVAGTAYDLYMQLPTGKVYFAGSMSGDYLATTTDSAAAVAIYFEEVTGGYHIYFMDGETKTYITAAAYLKSNGYAGCHFSLTTNTPTLAWTYDTTYGIIEIYDEIEGKSDTFFAGTYGTYNTVSLSGAYYKDQIASGSQYPARIEAIEGGEVVPPVGGDTPVDPPHEHTYVDGKCSCGAEDPNYQPPSEGGDEDDGVMSIPEVLASSEGTAVVVKGTVVEIYQSWSDQYNNISFYIADEAGNKLLVFRTGTKVNIGDQVTVTGKATLYNSVIQIAQGGITVIDVEHICSEFTEGSCTIDSKCVVCGNVGTVAPGHIYEGGVCTGCGEAEPTGDVIPGNLIFTAAENKASADSYMSSNFPEWKITGKLGQTYGGYLGFGRSGDSKSAITSPAFSTTSGFTVSTVLKGNGSSGVATSTVTFTLVDAAGNVVATGYANGSTTATITPVDGKDTTYTISFTFVEGKTWADATNLVVSFVKATGNIGLKSLNFVK